MQDNQERSAAGRRPRRVTYVSAAGVAVGLTALATAGLAGSAGSAGATDRSEAVTVDGIRTRTITVDVPAAGYASPSPSPTAKAPQMRLAVSYQRLDKVVDLTITLDGYVFEPLDANGSPVAFPTPATRAIGLGEELAWGDGTRAATAARPVHCGKPQTLHPVKDSYTVRKTYAASGTYTITYTFKACGLTDQKITATFPLTF